MAKRGKKGDASAGGFYSTEPQAPPHKKADSPNIHNAALIIAIPKIVNQNPGVSTGLGGMAHAGNKHVPKSHGYGHSVINRLGKLRLSGNTGSHQIGKK